MDEQDRSKLKADLEKVFASHGWSGEDSEELAEGSVELANGAVIAYKVPIIGTADCTI